MSDLISLLTLEALGRDQFQGVAGRFGWANIYGGQLIAQALAAANLTVDSGRLPHSLHANFIRPGVFDIPLSLEVLRDRDGAKFSSRRVTLNQSGKPILTLSASYHVDEQGPVRNDAVMPDVASVAELDRKFDADGVDGAKRNPSPISTVEIRAIDGCNPYDTEPGPPVGTMWLRIPGARSENLLMNYNLLAYLSDMMLIGAAMRPHRREITGKVLFTSLDHAVWFHGGVTPADEWLLYTQSSSWADHGRALCHGKIFTAAGRHIATVAQEALLRFGG